MKALRRAHSVTPTVVTLLCLSSIFLVSVCAVKVSPPAQPKSIFLFEADNWGNYLLAQFTPPNPPQTIYQYPLTTQYGALFCDGDGVDVAYALFNDTETNYLLYTTNLTTFETSVVNLYTKFEEYEYPSELFVWSSFPGGPRLALLAKANGFIDVDVYLIDTETGDLTLYNGILDINFVSKSKYVSTAYNEGDFYIIYQDYNETKPYGLLETRVIQSSITNLTIVQSYDNEKLINWGAYNPMLTRLNKGTTFTAVAIEAGKYFMVQLVIIYGELAFNVEHLQALPSDVQLTQYVLTSNGRYLYALDSTFSSFYVVDVLYNVFEMAIPIPTNTVFNILGYATQY
eukprot:TRINITY_DN8658_c0_g1_i1.p1 TRINITY_DN8658_c0_g1~~TRINITY_DN8658_c0_g1_i1.p1  ORF type:complete len:343 (-),score=50.75 TRINITY_DN8658_c0_g1_i1:61-1089(-)